MPWGWMLRIEGTERQIDTFAKMDPLSRESASNVAALGQFVQSVAWQKHNPKGGFFSVKLKHQASLGVLQRQRFKAQGVS